MATITLFLAGKKVQKYDITTSPFVVGRDPSCGLHIENVGVSRRHCQFVYDEGAFWVEDAGSSNGTFQGGKKLEGRAKLASGSEVNIGKYVLLFEDDGLNLLPQQTGEASADGGAAGGNVNMTFQMDPETLKAQMEKAKAAAANGVEESRRAADVANKFDPDAPLVIKGKDRSGSGPLGMIIKLLGLAIIVAGVIIGVLYAMAQ